MNGHLSWSVPLLWCFERLMMEDLNGINILALVFIKLLEDS